MTILDTPKEFTKEELVDYLRHCIEEIESGKVSLSDINWIVNSTDYPVASIYLTIELKQVILGKESRRLSDK